MQTSTTNIGAYLWSAVAAQRLGIISHRELVARLSRTIGHARSGWSATRRPLSTTGTTTTRGAKLTVWPPDRRAADADPLLGRRRLAGDRAEDRRDVGAGARRAARGALYRSIDFGFYYVPPSNRILFDYAPSTGARDCCYDTVGQREPDRRLHRHRQGRAAAEGVLRALADLPGHLRLRVPGDAAGRRRPATYFGVSVFEGAYAYDGHAGHAVLGRLMFEELMPALFVPEERWAPRLLGRRTTRCVVRAQIHHGLVDAGYGVWGFSPSNTPEGGYAAYGVDAIGMDPNGNPSNEAQRRSSTTASPAARTGRPSPTRRRRLHERRRHAARRRSWRCATRRPRRWPTSPGSRALPAALRPLGLPRQRQRADRRRRPAPTCRSTRA